MKAYIELMRGVTGSHAAGLATPTSDVDTMAVYCHGPEFYLGVAGTGVSRPKQTVKGGADTTEVELRHFLGECVKGNPNTLRLLFLAQHLHLSPEGEILVWNRDLFLTKSVVTPFLGYAGRLYLSSLQNDTGEGYNAKYMANAILVTEQLVCVLCGQGLPVRVDAETLEMLCMIRAGEFPRDDAIHQYSTRRDLCRELESDSTLPDSPDMKAVNALCTQVLTQTWKRAGLTFW